MGKEDVVHIYNGILLSHKKEWKKKPFAATQMDLEVIKIIILSKPERERQILNDSTYT